MATVAEMGHEAGPQLESNHSPLRCSRVLSGLRGEGDHAQGGGGASREPCAKPLPPSVACGATFPCMREKGPHCDISTIEGGTRWLRADWPIGRLRFGMRCSPTIAARR